ncbi:MAG: hypothetical protein DMG10_17915, partial [Acidobacteria bacterium]
FDAVAIEVADDETWPESTVENDRLPKDASQNSSRILHGRRRQWSGSGPLLRGRFAYGVQARFLPGRSGILAAEARQGQTQGHDQKT